MNSLQKEANISIDNLNTNSLSIEAACLIVYIKYKLSFATYNRLSEFLGAYNYSPHTEKNPISPALARNILELILDYPKPELFLLSFYADIISNHSTQTQSEVLSWIQAHL